MHLLCVLLASVIAFSTSTQTTPIANTTLLAPSAVNPLPNVAPYNLTLSESERSITDIGFYDRIAIFIDASHKKARLAYSDEPDPQIIGFDLYIRGRGKCMKPMEVNEKVKRKYHSGSFTLSLPIDPQNWQFAQVKDTYAKNQFTRREKFMRNCEADFYLRFRNPNGCDPDETQSVVERINKGKKLSLGGLTNIGKFLVTSSEEKTLLNSSFDKHKLQTVHLDAEYDSPVLGTEETLEGNDAGCVFAIEFPAIILVVSIGLAVASLIYGHYATFLILSYIAILFIEVICWAPFAYKC